MSASFPQNDSSTVSSQHKLPNIHEKKSSEESSKMGEVSQHEPFREQQQMVTIPSAERISESEGEENTPSTVLTNLSTSISPVDTSPSDVISQRHTPSHQQPDEERTDESRERLTVHTSNSSITRPMKLLSPVAVSHSTRSIQPTPMTDDASDSHSSSEHQWRPLSGGVVKSHHSVQTNPRTPTVLIDGSVQSQQHAENAAIPGALSIIASDTVSSGNNNNESRTVTTPESVSTVSSQGTGSTRHSTNNMFASPANEFAYLHPSSMNHHASPGEGKDPPSIRRHKKRSSSVLEKYQNDLNLILMKTPEEKSPADLVEEAKKLRLIVGEQEHKISNLKKSSHRLSNALEMWINHAKDKDNHLISTLKEGENKMNKLTLHVQQLREQRSRIEQKLAEEKTLKSKNTYIATNFDISRVKGNTTSYLCVNMYTDYADKTVLYDKKYTRNLLKRIKEYFQVFQPLSQDLNRSLDVLTDQDLDETLLQQYTERVQKPHKTIKQQDNDLKIAVKNLLKKLKAHEEAYHLRQKIFLQNKEKARVTIEQLQKEYKFKEKQKEVEELEYVLKETRSATQVMESKHLQDMENLEEELNKAKKQYEKAMRQSDVMKERIDYYKSIAESRPRNSLEDAPSGKIAIVFTDVESSTALWMEDSKSMQEAMNLHNILLKNLIEKIGPGFTVKTEGDALFVVWQDCRDALAFALEAQLRLTQVEWPEGLFNSRYKNPAVSEVIDEGTGQVLFRGLRVRIGIHFGEAQPTIDEVTGLVDYFGASISKSARICALAKGGQVLLSNDAYESVRSLIDDSFGIPVWTERKGTARLRGMESEPDILWLVLPKELSKREAPSKIVVEYSKEEQYRLELRKLEKRYNRKCAQINKIQSNAQAKYSQLERTHVKARKKLRELMKELDALKQDAPSKKNPKTPHKLGVKKGIGRKRSTSKLEERSSSWNDDADGHTRRKEIGERVDKTIDRLDQLSSQVELSFQQHANQERENQSEMEQLNDVNSKISHEEVVKEKERKASSMTPQPHQAYLSRITMGVDHTELNVIGRGRTNTDQRRDSEDTTPLKKRSYNGLSGLISISDHEHRMPSLSETPGSTSREHNQPLESRHKSASHHVDEDQVFIDIPEEIVQQQDDSSAISTIQQLEEVLNSLSSNLQENKEPLGPSETVHKRTEPKGDESRTSYTRTVSSLSDFSFDDTRCNKTTQTNYGVNAQQYETLEKVKTLLQQYQTENTHLQKELQISKSRLLNADDHIQSLGKLTKLWNTSEISLRAMRRRDQPVVYRSPTGKHNKTLVSENAMERQSFNKAYEEIGEEQSQLIKARLGGSSTQTPSGNGVAVIHSSPTNAHLRRDMSPARRSSQAANAVSLFTSKVMQPHYEDRSVPSPQTPQFLDIVAKPPTTASNNASRRGSGNYTFLEGLKPVILG
mmetsp:Transcript_10649/g.39749  ORF Transcript_10649/g.39749 Transcript_10649/m.39749 type:complete len:1420 (-) Transcript_10649:27-4286(-)|eukprot:CAMPEP_0117443776 /NCGR_PEP_ID=MMETSP0759-20121206/4879_1 /TAXON_ID=63605 /ORGANISM="Percolomonas cosmopolitus, Strain WS" /LENGTH=1419 /DNA_ID=CAMNT_0005235781 /DNA_START=433 /DNA_END=4692 /DNA_ORIENTATION=-